MEFIDSIWQVGIIALLAGAMIGALAYRHFSPSVRQADEIKAELDHAKRQLSDYRSSVNSHFAKTSELVNDLTHNYVKVYQHLAEGAQTLGDSRALNNLLEQQQGKVLLAVDDENEATETVARASRPEPVAESEERASSDAGEAAVETGAAESPPPGGEENAEATAKASAATRAESAEAPPDESLAAAASRDPEAAPEARAQGPAKTPKMTSGEEAGTGEPILDVSKIDGKRAGADDGGSTPDVATVMPEPEDAEGVKPTRH